MDSIKSDNIRSLVSMLLPYDMAIIRQLLYDLCSGLPDIWLELNPNGDREKLLAEWKKMLFSKNTINTLYMHLEKACRLKFNQFRTMKAAEILRAESVTSFDFAQIFRLKYGNRFIYYGDIWIERFGNNDYAQGSCVYHKIRNLISTDFADDLVMLVNRSRNLYKHESIDNIYLEHYRTLQSYSQYVSKLKDNKFKTEIIDSLKDLMYENVWTKYDFVPGILDMEKVCDTVVKMPDVDICQIKSKYSDRFKCKSLAENVWIDSKDPYSEIGGDAVLKIIFDNECRDLHELIKSYVMSVSESNAKFIENMAIIKHLYRYCEVKTAKEAAEWISDLIYW